MGLNVAASGSLKVIDKFCQSPEEALEGQGKRSKIGLDLRPSKRPDQEKPNSIPLVHAGGKGITQ